MTEPEKKRVRPLTVLAMISTLAQFALIEIGWLIQAGLVSLIFYGIATVLFIITWAIPWFVRTARETRRQDAAIREKKRHSSE